MSHMNMSGANFFGNTATSGFFKEGGSLLGNIDNMTNEQLKDRLMVAETLMKKLYNRNKDVELYHKQKLENERKKSREREASQSPHKANRAGDDGTLPSQAPNLTNKKDN